MGKIINRVDQTLEITFATSPDVVKLTVDTEVLIGRADKSQTVFTGLDLSPYDGDKLGVSRRHAIIRREGDKLLLVDLNSNNGTVVNGSRLEPDTPKELADGDTIYVGHLKLTIRILQNVGTSTIRYTQADLNLQNAPLVGRGQRVMIVEDDVMISKLYQVALEKAGYVVQLCKEVVGAIRALNQTTPSVILLDMRLPSIHGLELCRYVRRDTEYPSVPIVAVSALTDELAIQQAIEAGVDVYVAKPVNIKEMIAVVGAIIHHHEKENPNASTKRLTGTASLDHITAAPRVDTVVMFVEGQREPLGVVVQPAVTFGRQNPGNATTRHIDLEPYGAFDKGVSRVHCIMRRRNKGFVVEDLDSVNGTFVNGYSLRPQESHPLKNGDELRLGELRMHVYMLAEAETGPLVNEAKPDAKASEPKIES